MLEFIYRVMAWHENQVTAWHENNDRGASAVEYVLVLAAVIGVIGLAVFALGNRASGLLHNACTALGTTTC